VTPSAFICVHPRFALRDPRWHATGASIPRL
jgi:hypothetical protein